MDSVFISHVEEDQHLALEIATGLEASGLQTWYYERDSDPGPSYLLQVHHAIEKCAAVVLLISPHSIRSHQMTKEVARASDLGKPFIPVRFNISHAEFQQRQPEWNIAVGAATSIPVPSVGVSEIMPRIVRGIEYLGVSSDRVPSRNPQREVSSIETLGARKTDTPDLVAGPIRPALSSDRHESVSAATLRLPVAIAQRRTIAAVVASLLVALGVGIFLSRANRPSADELESLGGSTPPQVLSQSNAKPTIQANANPRPADLPRDVRPPADPVRPSQAPRSGALNPSQSVTPSDRVTDDARPRGDALEFDEECVRLLQIVREERQKKEASESALAELAQLEQRVARMRQEYAKYDREDREHKTSVANSGNNRASIEDEIKQNDRTKLMQSLKALLNVTSSQLDLLRTSIGRIKAD